MPWVFSGSIKGNRKNREYMIGTLKIATGSFTLILYEVFFLMKKKVNINVCHILRSLQLYVLCQSNSSIISDQNYYEENKLISFFYYPAEI